MWPGLRRCPTSTSVVDGLARRPAKPTSTLDATYYDTPRPPPGPRAASPCATARRGRRRRGRSSCRRRRRRRRRRPGAARSSIVAGPADAVPAELAHARRRPWLRARAARRRWPACRPCDAATALVDGDGERARRGRRRRGVGARRPAGWRPGSARSRSRSPPTRADGCSTPSSSGCAPPAPARPTRRRRSCAPSARGARAPPTSPPATSTPEPTAAEVVRAGIAASVRPHRRARPGRPPRRRPRGRAPGAGRAPAGCAPTCARSGSLLDPAWAEPLRDELKWLAGALGAVRDADVLSSRLASGSRRCSRDDDRRRPTPSSPASTASEARRGRARVAALDSRRYLALLDRLVDAADHRRAARRGRGARPRDGAARRSRARRGAPAQGGRRRSASDPADEELHEVRIRAKRARYAAEVAAPVVGEPAKRLAKAVGGAPGRARRPPGRAVAEEWLRGAARRRHQGPGLRRRRCSSPTQRRRGRAACRGEWRRRLGRRSTGRSAVLARTCRDATPVVRAPPAAWCGGVGRRRASRCCSCTGPSTTTGRSRRASSTPARPTRTCAAPRGRGGDRLALRARPRAARRPRYIDRKGRPKLVRYWAMTVAEAATSRPTTRSTSCAGCPSTTAERRLVLRPRRRGARRLRPLRRSPLERTPR